MVIRSTLSKLVSTNSIYPNEKALTKVLVSMLEKIGFAVTLQKIEIGRSNILASRGDNPKILFYGHQDTVPLVNKEDWQSDPFELLAVKNALFGLGSYDMKGGIAAFLTALSKSKADAKVFLAVDEENISQGAWKAIEEKKDFFDGLELVISAEPNFDLGLQGITTARTGRVIYEVIAKGIPEHISMYEQAEDAIEKLSMFTTNIYRTRKFSYKDEKTIVQVRKISGEAVGMSVPARAEAEVEVLLGADDTIESVKETLLNLGNVEVQLKKRITSYLTGYRFNEIPYEKQIAGIIEEYTKKKMTTHERSSVGDDNVLATLGIPVITWGPDGGNAHKPNEWVSLKSLEVLSNMYQELLESI